MVKEFKKTIQQTYSAGIKTKIACILSASAG
jgi:hypothetical protein